MIRYSKNLTVKIIFSLKLWPAKTSVSPRSSPLGTFRLEERLQLSDRNSILMTSCETSPAAKSEEKWMFLQATKTTECYLQHSGTMTFASFFLNSLY